MLDLTLKWVLLPSPAPLELYVPATPLVSTEGTVVVVAELFPVIPPTVFAVWVPMQPKRPIAPARTKILELAASELRKSKELSLILMVLSPAKKAYRLFRHS
jgi:hypothetical protein